MIIYSGLFSILVAGSTSAIAWLLDPAIEKIFLEKDQTLLIFIPLLIILAFSTKGISLYIAKSFMIIVAEEIKKKLQIDMIRSLIKADTQSIDKKHTGKFISNLTYDVQHITNLLSNAVLSLFKDSLTLIGLLVVMFSYICLMKVWYNNKFNSCCEMTQINHATFHIQHSDTLYVVTI